MTSAAPATGVFRARHYSDLLVTGVIFTCHYNDMPATVVFHARHYIHTRSKGVNLYSLTKYKKGGQKKWLTTTVFIDSSKIQKGGFDQDSHDHTN